LTHKLETAWFQPLRLRSVKTWFQAFAFSQMQLVYRYGAGINRLLEIQMRPRINVVGAAFPKPGAWEHVLKFTMKVGLVALFTTLLCSQNTS
jgi:hypothetical protein